MHHARTLSALLFALLGNLLASETLAQRQGQDEYELMGYYQPATDNRVAALSARLQSGEVKLDWQGERGYLDSLLAALDISPHSQLLVFSKTSLQYQLIDTQTPRAIYFNDDTYIGWVQHSNIVEVMAMDAKLGIVFYTFNNRQQAPQFDAQSGRCLVCHDTTGLTGGGTPELMAHSAIYDLNDLNLKNISGDGNVIDSTPIAERWGGWYVSGMHGAEKHLGNIRVQPEELPRLDELRRGNIATLEDLFDTTPYLTPTSDIVALLVLEHQLTVQNQLTYVRFKAPAVLQRIQVEATATTWAELPEKGQRGLTRMLDNLVHALLFSDATNFADRIDGLAEFQTAFLAPGPRDGKGRSLRELELETRLFRYPLSYLIYSGNFETLPAYARDYVYSQIAAVLEGRNQDAAYAHISAEQRREVLDILRDTKPDILPYLSPANSTD
jgi:hypothetical protein